MTLNLPILSKLKRLPVIITMLSLLAFSHTTNAMEKVTAVLDVPGMTCKFCPITIRKALEKVPGVVGVKAEYDSKTATVTFDPSKTNIEILIKATANAGYPSSVKK